MAIIVNTDLVGKAMMCAQQNQNPQAISDCIVAATSISADCAMCHSALIGCMFSNCGAMCGMGQTPACEQCVQTQCGTDFQTCSGLDLNEQAN